MLLCAGLLACGSAAAALPPGAQRAREIQAVVAEAALRLREPAEEVRWIEPGRYEVRGGDCRVEVRVVPFPPKRDRNTPPGPMPFAAIAGQVTCDR